MRARPNYGDSKSFPTNHCWPKQKIRSWIFKINLLWIPRLSKMSTLASGLLFGWLEVSFDAADVPNWSTSHQIHRLSIFGRHLLVALESLSSIGLSSIEIRAVPFVWSSLEHLSEKPSCLLKPCACRASLHTQQPPTWISSHGPYALTELDSQIQKRWTWLSWSDKLIKKQQLTKSRLSRKIKFCVKLHFQGAVLLEGAALFFNPPARGPLY